MHQNQRMQIVGVVGEAAVGFLPVDSELEALLFCHCMILPLITGSSPGTFGHKKIHSAVDILRRVELHEQLVLDGCYDVFPTPWSCSSWCGCARGHLLEPRRSFGARGNNWICDVGAVQNILYLYGLGLFQV